MEKILRLLSSIKRFRLRPLEAPCDLFTTPTAVVLSLTLVLAACGTLRIPSALSTRGAKPATASKTEFSNSPEKPPVETLEETKEAIRKIEQSPLFTPCKEGREMFVNYLNKYKDPRYTDSLPTYMRSVGFLINIKTGTYAARVSQYQDFLLWTKEIEKELNYEPWKHPDFSIKQYVAHKALVEELPKVRRMDLRRYYVTMLYRALVARPSMFKDPLTERTCKYFETSLESGDDSELPKKFDIFLRKARVTPKQIHYSEDWASSAEVEVSEKTLGYTKLAWDHLKTTQSLKPSREGQRGPDSADEEDESPRYDD